MIDSVGDIVYLCFVVCECWEGIDGCFRVYSSLLDIT